MIGHVFSSSGAVCLAIAPHVDRHDEYVVLARYEAGYAIAPVRVSALPAPTSWANGSYFDDDDLDQAIEAFLEDTGLQVDIAAMRRRIEYAEGSCLPRVVTATAEKRPR